MTLIVGKSVCWSLALLSCSVSSLFRPAATHARLEASRASRATSAAFAAASPRSSSQASALRVCRPWSASALLPASLAATVTPCVVSFSFASDMRTTRRTRGAESPVPLAAVRRGGGKKGKDIPGDTTAPRAAKLEELESATERLWPSPKIQSAKASRAVVKTERRKKTKPPTAPAVGAIESVDATDGAGAGKGSGGTNKKPKGASAASEKKSKRKAAADAGDTPGSPGSSPSKKRVPIAPGSLSPPEGWRDVYDLVVELRAVRDAPVDWAGCEVVGRGDEFHILVALMLSSQTKDQVVSETMLALKAWPRGGLSVDSILSMTDQELDKIIAKVGFHNNKTRYIKQTAQILKDKYQGRVPRTAEELCSLPGIGPKMAYIILSAAFNIVTGIGVDTHMHRIFNILQWVSSKTPEQTREQLEGWLPREEWGKVNVLFVGLGQGTQQPAERHRLLRRCIDCSRPTDALRLVHSLGTDISSAASTDAAGETALMYSVRQKNLEAARVLLELGAKPQLRDASGKTALDLALETRQPKLEKVLAAAASSREKEAKAPGGQNEA